MCRHILSLLVILNILLLGSPDIAQETGAKLHFSIAAFSIERSIVRGFAPSNSFGHIPVVLDILLTGYFISVVC